VKNVLSATKNAGYVTAALQEEVNAGFILEPLGKIHLIHIGFSQLVWQSRNFH
jgi:hypothetical protein